MKISQFFFGLGTMNDLIKACDKFVVNYGISDN